jgi:amidophosphoribosyltransferase
VIIAARDPYGFRPLVLAASASRWWLHRKRVRSISSVPRPSEVRVGEIVAMESPDNLRHPSIPVGARGALHLRACLSRAARLDDLGNTVAEVRSDSAQLAREHPVDADIVVPVPDSGTFAAMGYARESGIPFGTASCATTTSAARSSSRSRPSVISA